MPRLFHETPFVVVVVYSIQNLHLIDSQLNTFKISSRRLSINKENVCMAINTDNTVYAIGSASYVQLLHADTAKSLVPPIFIKKDIGMVSSHVALN